MNYLFLVASQIKNFTFFIKGPHLKRAKLAGAKKLPVARQYAWVQTKLLLCAHQGLNVEHPNKGLNYDHSRFVNRSKYYESPDNFHQ
jgi:hypothetical protein